MLRSGSTYPTVAVKAENQGELLGVIEIRNNAHLSLLFVSPDHQRQGIGKQLLAAAIKWTVHEDPNLKKLTVHASPNSVRAYEKLGFSTISAEKEVNGIRFTSMEKVIGIGHRLPKAPKSGNVTRR